MVCYHTLAEPYWLTGKVTALQTHLRKKKKKATTLHFLLFVLTLSSQFSHPLEGAYILLAICLVEIIITTLL